MLVEATKKGYFGLKVRDEGDKFEVKDEKAVSKLWMKPVTSANPSVAVGVEFDSNGDVVNPSVAVGDVVKPSDGDVVKPSGGDVVKPSGGVSYKGKR